MFRDGGRLVLYTIGWIIFVISVIESFLGYILVWGNMSYWGASVIINILAIVPFIGNVLVNFIWCSSTVVLNFAITIHFLVGLIIIVLIILHILYLHNVSSSSPFINSSSSLTIPFFPIFFKDLFAIILLFLFCSYNFLIFEVESIYGNVQNLIPASPTATPIHILPEWYFLLFYSILRSFPNKVGGALIVLTFFIMLMKSSEIVPNCINYAFWCGVILMILGIFFIIYYYNIDISLFMSMDLAEQLRACCSCWECTHDMGSGNEMFPRIQSARRAEYLYESKMGYPDYFWDLSECSDVDDNNMREDEVECNVDLSYPILAFLVVVVVTFAARLSGF